MGRISSERTSLPVWSKIILYIFSTLLFVIQIGVFALSINFYFNRNVLASTYAPYFLITTYIIAIITTIFVIRRSIPTNYKLTWCILIMALPVPFSVLYFLNQLEFFLLLVLYLNEILFFCFYELFLIFHL